MGTGSERHREVKPPASFFVVVIFFSSCENYWALIVVLNTEELKEALAGIVRV